MGWPELMLELETKLKGVLMGTYRPLDNVAFFRVQYPPAEEREALRQFRLLAGRLRQEGWEAASFSLLDLLRQGLVSLLNCPPPALKDRLLALEQDYRRAELKERLSEHLPGEIIKALTERLQGMARESVAILLRMGALYPFMRPSSLLARLEGQIACTVVLPYPGTTLGALLDSAPADTRGGYYRGEIIPWP